MHKTINYTDSTLTPPALPTELWLQILEITTIYDASHLWTSVRHVSQRFRNCVERLFISQYLPKFAISLALPRRDPTTGALRWPGAPIPGAQIIMSFAHVTSDQRYVVFRSPIALNNGSELKSVEELKDASVLPQERLQTAQTWVYFNNNSLTGHSIGLQESIDWDDTRKVWVWEVDWRELMNKFYKAKKHQKSGKNFESGRLGQGRVKYRGH